MNTYLEQLKQKILSEVNPEWNKDEILRFVYIRAGKKLQKNFVFFYSLGGRLQDQGLSYEELRRKYEYDEVEANEMICKSTTYFLKSIYDELGIETKVMQSTIFQKISDTDTNQSFDLYHYFLCATGEEGKKYFLTLSSDFMNIQNNFQTQHFASKLDYQQRPINGVSSIAYQGEEIHETVLSNDELAALDRKIGYLPRFRNIGSSTMTISDFVYYENGVILESIALENSPYIYEKIRSEMTTPRGYIQYLARNSEFYQESFTFVNSKGKQISFNETKLSECTEEDLEDWRHYMDERITLQDSKQKQDCFMRINIMYHHFLEIRNICLQIENMPPSKERNKKMAEVKRKRTSAYKLLEMISYYFVDDDLKDKKKDMEYTTKYLQHRFETIFADFMMFNKEEPSMLSRCNGVAEKIELIDKVLIDFFGGNIFSKRDRDAHLGRSVSYNPETREYQLFFHINSEIYYLLNLDTGKLEIVPDVLETISNQPHIFVDEIFRNQILDIEESSFQK